MTLLGAHRTAIVLAGGAARGAYEVGVLQHVLEDVARDLGHPVRLGVISGTSVGALNACGLAAFADLPPSERIARVVEVWTGLDVTDLVRLDVKGIVAMGARLLGRASPPGAVPVREGGVIDPDGLERLVARAIPFDRIERNLRDNHLDALTVSTTHVASGRTVVHVQCREAELPSWSHDPTTVARATRITARHALASAAIPILFRAVELDGDWHCDGGLRQNVPLSPARRLGAARVLVINPRFISTAPLDDRAADDFFPGPLFLLGKTLNALLLDRIDTDLARLQTINRILAAGTEVAGEGFVGSLNRAMGFPEGQGLRPMDALLVRASADIGVMAAEHVRSPAGFRPDRRDDGAAHARALRAAVAERGRPALLSPLRRRLLSGADRARSGRRPGEARGAVRILRERGPEPKNRERKPERRAPTPTVEATDATRRLSRAPAEPRPFVLARLGRHAVGFDQALMSSARRTLRAARRGFTLVELMMVLAIVMVLLNRGHRRVPGKYIHAAQSAEAKTVLGQIRSGEEAYRVEMLNYLSCSTSLVDYYPNAAPDDSRWVWKRSTDGRYSSATTGWAMLNVNPDGPVRYGYAVMAGVSPAPLASPDPSFAHPPIWPSNLPSGTPWFVAGARNQHFNGAAGPPSLLVTTSYDGTIYSENDER